MDEHEFIDLVSRRFRYRVAGVLVFFLGFIVTGVGYLFEFRSIWVTLATGACWIVAFGLFNRVDKLHKLIQKELRSAPNEV